MTETTEVGPLPLAGKLTAEGQPEDSHASAPLSARIVWRQGVRLYYDGEELGYYACSGIDAMILLCALHLRGGVDVRENEFNDLRDWIVNG